ncbi:rab11 family-interacting protein 4 isoform X2 [Cylas formicarius]|uniref:rab11 family-interacting protein 4 isoform X2 n=1 Tax=Cylas formicarius TaxID=197179 RepID=UPI0029589994|nr:rab11 family-interacting protein 4 isoform X2 [Cylas formicarius]
MMSPTVTNAEDSPLGSGTLRPHFELTAASPNGDQNASQCSSLSDGENFEWSGVAEETNGNVALARNNNNLVVAGSSPSGINRNTWLRTSLRRSSPSNPDSLPNRRWGSFRHTARRQNLGSNALASQLYRSSSFNSSGRSSTCDTTDDMYSDASLEEDVHDLHHKFQVLQQQVGVLQDNAHQNDERYTRAKAENAALHARVLMLEEQLRDTELRYEDRLQDEQKRCREAVARLEREKQLQLENASIRLQNAETQCAKLAEELARCRSKCDKLEAQRDELVAQLQEAGQEAADARDEAKRCRDRENRLTGDRDAQEELLREFSREVERLRAEARTPALPTTSPEGIRLEELQREMEQLRERNTQLRDSNEELQASLLHAGLETGRRLADEEASLARELDVMSQDEALREQQEVNRQLRAYIDGILLNIVENHPQLLEVKQKRCLERPA